MKRLRGQLCTGNIHLTSHLYVLGCKSEEMKAITFIFQSEELNIRNLVSYMNVKRSESLWTAGHLLKQLYHLNVC